MNVETTNRASYRAAAGHDAGGDATTTAPSIVPDLQLDGVSRRFGDTVAVNDVSFATMPGELLSFVGPSGCGKTTTLSMIAGFLEPSSGSINIRGRRVDMLPPEKRNTGMVFQNYALFPHMSVAENVAFGLRMRGVGREETRTEVTKALHMVQMSAFGDRRPEQLSGGQQQRVALARALVIRPHVLLLDEPFGALDRQLREGMQLELRALQQSVGISTIFVTHDQDEALSMSDRVAVMSKGRIEQIGSPVETYEKPMTTFVAKFIGKSNFISGEVVAQEAGRTVLDTGIGRIDLPQLRGVEAGAKVECMVRPEKLRLATEAASPQTHRRVSGIVRQTVYQGASLELHVTAGDLQLVAATRTHELGGAAIGFSGSAIELDWPISETLVFRDGTRCLAA